MNDQTFGALVRVTGWVEGANGKPAPTLEYAGPLPDGVYVAGQQVLELPKVEQAKAAK